MLNEQPFFKQCSMCGKSWNSLEEFAQDESLQLNGYQVNLHNPKDGLVLLTHELNECHSTLAVRADTLRPLYTGPVYTEVMMGGTDCEGWCLKQHDFSQCKAHCAYGWIREVMQILQEHQVFAHHE